jgi:TonB-dependent receptor
MNLSLPLKHRILLVSLFTIFSFTSFAQTIKGNVTDAKTGETLIGATVHIKNEHAGFNASVKLDGSYLFKNIPAGIYKLQVTFVGYKTTNEYAVEATTNGAAVLNIAMVDNSTALHEVAITEHISRESDYSARADEKNGTTTMNVVSANTIAISPDVLVSNVLQRVSGITVDRSNNGDADHVIIRGMEKQYNTVLINGVKIPSPDDKNRYIPLDIFPADLVASIEVIKTLTPDMEGDASGGVVNMVMKSAPDHLEIEGDLGTGYSQLFLDRGFSSFNGSTVNSKAPGQYLPPGAPASISDFPYQNLVTKTGNAPPNTNASLTIGNRYLNNKLGVLFSGTYQNSYEGSNGFAVIQENTVQSAVNYDSPIREPSFQSSYNRQYSSQLSRLGTIASIDYKFDDNNVINLFATYLQLDEYRVRNSVNSVYSGYSYNGYLATNEVDNLTETRTDKQSIYNFTLKGKHKVTKAFSLDWILADSKASHNLPDDAEFKTEYETSPGNGTNVPTPGSPGSSTYVAQTQVDGPVVVDNESRMWEINTDKDLSAYLNLHYNLDIFGRKAIFSAGGMIRHKTRDNFADTYALNPVADPGSVTGNETYVSIPASTFTFNSPSDATGSTAYDGGTYTFEENIHAGYGMLDYAISDRLNAVFGLRYESTYQTYNSNLPVTFPGKYATIVYGDYLPSINLKYSLTDDQAIRAAFYKSILRPAFADIVPFGDPVADEYYNTVGNPYILHTAIDNYDLRYEFFPGVFDEFMVGGFYKYLINPIERQLAKSSDGAALAITPVNLPNAYNYGAELNAKKFFGNIGFAVNYTYTQSVATSPKLFPVENQTTTVYKNQTRPLQGQADNVGNVSLLYKSPKYGIEAQLALSYTGERIAYVSEYYDLDTWERATTYLDFSAQKTIGKHFEVFVKVNNILNTPYELFIKQNNSLDYNSILKYPDQKSPDYTTLEYDQYYTRYNMGLRFKF